MRAAKRKWANRRAAFEGRRRRDGENAAHDWLKRFDEAKVKKHIFA